MPNYCKENTKNAAKRDWFGFKKDERCMMILQDTWTNKCKTKSLQKREGTWYLSGT